MNGEKEKEKFFVKEEFIEWWAESFAEAIKRHTAKIEWLEVREVRLDEAKHAHSVTDIPPMGFDSGNYIRVLYLDGAASLTLDTFGSYEFDLTIATEFKQLYHQPFITSEAQPGKKLILALGRGDFSFPEFTQKVQPADIQAQLRTVVADSITPLGANGLYESLAFDALNYSRITLLVLSDQASATNGVQVQQSIDGEDGHWDYSTDYTLVAGVPVAATIELVARYMRVRYTNGVVAQDTFRLAALARII